MAASIPEPGVYGQSRPARDCGELQTQSKIIHSLNDSVDLQDGLEFRCANPSKKIIQPNNSPTPHHSRFCQNIGIGGGLTQGILQCDCLYCQPNIIYTTYTMLFSVLPF